MHRQCLGRIHSGGHRKHMSRFDLTEDQIAIRDMARGFASDKLAPNALSWDEHKHFPVDVLRESAALGMGGIYVREDVGGSGLTHFDAALIFEALAAGDPSIPLISPSITWSPG
jgi:alkylation response protein AidB-like acyl-CoA dehydrogenase